MYINKIILKNYRNYSFQEILLNKDINIFFGDNAQGKTNIIEAIYISSIGKSFRTKRDLDLINIEKKNENTSGIEIEFEKKDRKGNIKININEKKEIYINDVKLNKLSEILGNINIVLFSPDDIKLFKDGPAKRRKALDIMIGQLRPAYIYNLNIYLKTLEQRNNYLRLIKYEKKTKEFLEILDEKLAEYAEKIFLYRKEYIEKIKNKITNIHLKITEEKEKINIEFNSDFKNKEKFLNLLKQERDNDIQKGYTTKGIHRDDYKISINDKDINIFGSQGQHRTVLLSLKISELNIIHDEIGESPILLLDDFMSELDEQRKKNFLENIRNAQVIITCTEKIDIENLDFISYNIREGKIYDI